MTDQLTNDFVTFASRFGLTPAEATVLPALFGKIADITGRQIRVLVIEATFQNRPLGDYIAGIARDVSKTVAA